MSPVVPHTTGNGLAMRAGMVLRLLARSNDVSLLVVPLHGPAGTPIPSEFADECRRVAVVRRDAAQLSASALVAAASIKWPSSETDPLARTRRTAFADVDFDLVHLYRVSTLPYALPFLFDSQSPVARHLDLDEAESASRRRLAAFHRDQGRETVARFCELEADLSARVEREVLARFDRVYTCSALERDQLSADPRRGPVRVLPNVLPPADPADSSDDRPRDPFTFLFVGTLGFLPNQDAVRFMCDEVLPRLRRLATRSFELAIVGAGGTEAIRDVAEIPEVRLVGAVASVAPWYTAASAVVVPLRFGGGTRIKVLEAMRARRPIVSTSDGMAGLEVRPDVHLLVADSADAFAAQCTRLMKDAELADRLRTCAYDLFAERYTPDAVAATLDA